MWTSFLIAAAIACILFFPASNSLSLWARISRLWRLATIAAIYNFARSLEGPVLFSAERPLKIPDSFTLGVSPIKADGRLPGTVELLAYKQTYQLLGDNRPNTFN